MNTKEKVMKVVRDPKAQIGLSLAVATLCLVTPQASQSRCPDGDDNDCGVVRLSNGQTAEACIIEWDAVFDDCI